LGVTVVTRFGYARWGGGRDLYTITINWSFPILKIWNMYDNTCCFGRSFWILSNMYGLATSVLLHILYQFIKSSIKCQKTFLYTGSVVSYFMLATCHTFGQGLFLLGAICLFPFPLTKLCCKGRVKGSKAGESHLRRWRLTGWIVRGRGKRSPG
jgi:hypothetical protein